VPLLGQLIVEPPQTATVLGADVGKAPLDESQSKLNRLKAINTEHSCQDFVAAEANCVDPAIEFTLAVLGISKTGDAMLRKLLVGSVID